MATIITKNSQTPGAVPSAASLGVGELAVNTADGKLYTEHTGGVVKEIIPSTVSDGGITTAKIADGAITTAKIADGNVTGAKLENSGVTAGSYGSSSDIPVVTVDAKGRLTSISTTSVAASAPTTAQVLSAYAGASVGGVGVYATTYSPTVNAAIGATIAGSTLRGMNSSGEIINPGFGGTWRVVGCSHANNAGYLAAATLVLRIS